MAAFQSAQSAQLRQQMNCIRPCWISRGSKFLMKPSDTTGPYKHHWKYVSIPACYLHTTEAGLFQSILALTATAELTYFIILACTIWHDTKMAEAEKPASRDRDTDNVCGDETETLEYWYVPTTS